jgi:hypothetical protein
MTLFSVETIIYSDCSSLEGAVWTVSMSADKRVRRVTDAEQQQLETYLYWQSLPIGDRLSAVWDVSEAAYSFAAAFKGVRIDDAQGSERLAARIQPARR